MMFRRARRVKAARASRIAEEDLSANLLRPGRFLPRA